MFDWAKRDERSAFPPPERRKGESFFENRIKEELWRDVGEQRRRGCCGIARPRRLIRRARDLGLATTTSIDGAGRVTLQQTGSAGSTAGTIGTLVQKVETQYDSDSNPTFITTSQLNTDGSTYFVTCVGNWYDVANRVTETVNYGTNNSTPMSARPDIASITGPAGKPTELTAYYYVTRAVSSTRPSILWEQQRLYQRLS